MASNNAHSISLAWTNPTDPDFAGVLIRRAVGDTAPIAASDGTLVATLSSRQTAFTDKHLTTASTYSYAVFLRYGSRTAGVAATLTTATRSTSNTTGLRGKLTDQQGRAISRANVEVREASTGNGVAGTATSSTGQFSVAGLTPGVYLLCFFTDDGTTGHSATGYLPGCYRQQPYGYGNTGTPVTVLAGKMTSGLVDYLPAAGALSGRVTGSDGAMLGGVWVTADNVQTGQGFAASSDQDGSYRLSGLTEGDYLVCFSASLILEPSSTGYVDKCYDDQSVSSPRTPVHVAAGGVTAGIDAELTVGAAITGQVTDLAGNGIPNVFVQTSGAGGSDQSPVGTTDDLGHYRVTGLPATAVVVCFFPGEQGSANGTGFQSECYDDQPNASTASPVNTTAGQVSTGVDAELAVGAEITGRVTDSAGNGIWDVSVLTYSVGGSYLGRAGMTDNTGHYRIVGVPAGAVVVCFQTYPDGGANGTGYLSECYDNQPDVSSANPVNTTAGQVRAGIDAELADAPA